MKEVKILKDRRVNDVSMGFFCQHKMAEVKLTLDVSAVTIETGGEQPGERKKLIRSRCDHQDQSCGGCRETEKIKAKLEFFEL